MPEATADKEALPDPKTLPDSLGEDELGEDEVVGSIDPLTEPVAEERLSVVEAEGLPEGEPEALGEPLGLGLQLFEKGADGEASAVRLELLDAAAVEDPLALGLEIAEDAGDKELLTLALPVKDALPLGRSEVDTDAVKDELQVRLG